MRMLFVVALPQKRVTGEAYVNVHTTDMRDVAVRTLHGRMMGPRWIEVRRLHVVLFHSAVVWSLQEVIVEDTRFAAWQHYLARRLHGWFKYGCICTVFLCLTRCSGQAPKTSKGPCSEG